jgi:hypothetical protein
VQDVEPLDVECMALDLELADDAPVPGDDLERDRGAEHVDERIDDLAGVALPEGLGGGRRHGRARAGDGQPGQPERGLVAVDPGQHPDGAGVILGVAGPDDEDLPEPGHGAGVAHGGQGRLGVLGRLAALVEMRPEALEHRAPVPVGLLPGPRVGDRSVDLLGGHPPTPVTPEAQVAPGRLARRLQPDERRQVRPDLGTEPVPLAPEGQLPMVLGPVRVHRRPTGLVLRQRPGHRLGGRLGHLVPSAVDLDHPQQAARPRVVGTLAHGEREVADSLVLEPVPLAPEGQPDVSLRPVPGARPGGLVVPRPIAPGRDQQRGQHLQWQCH